MIIETKYNIGDKVWLMEDNKPKEYEIIGFTVNKGKMRTTEQFLFTDNNYILLDFPFRCQEHNIFKTKEELLASL